MVKLVSDFRGSQFLTVWHCSARQDPASSEQSQIVNLGVAGASGRTCACRDHADKKNSMTFGLGPQHRQHPPLAACFDPDATLPNKAAENRRKLQFVERAPPPIDQDFTTEPNFRCPQCKEPYCKWQTYFSKKLGRHLMWARCSAYSKIHNSLKCPFYVYHPGNLNLIRSTTAASSAVQID